MWVAAAPIVRPRTPPNARHHSRAPAASLLLSSSPSRAARSRDVDLPALPVHLHRLPEPLRVRAVPDAGARPEVRRDDRRLRADDHRRGAAVQRGPLDLRHDHQPGAAGLPGRQAGDHRGRRLLDRRLVRVGVQGGPRARQRPGAAQPAQHGQAQGHQPRRARGDLRDHRLGRLRRDRLPHRAARTGRAVHRPRGGGGRRPGPRLQPQRQLALEAADDQVLLRPGAPEEPRAGAALGDVPVGLPHRLPPPRAARTRADPREPQHRRHPDQVRRGPVPDPADQKSAATAPS